MLYVLFGDFTLYEDDKEATEAVAATLEVVCVLVLDCRGDAGLCEYDEVVVAFGAGLGFGLGLELYVNRDVEDDKDVDVPND